jgi:RING finger family protein
MADIITPPDTTPREDDTTALPEATVRNNIVGTLSQGRIVTFVRWFIYISSLLQLLAIGAVLGITWEHVCEPDLRPYLVLYSVNLVAYFACTLYFHHAHTPVDINTLRYVSSEETRLDRFFKGFYEGARVSWLLITLYGGALLSNSTACQKTSPPLFILTFILVAYNILIIVLPFILLFLFICSLPFLIIVARRLVSVNGTGHAGADQDTINAVPLHQYTATEDHSYDGVSIPSADAKCIICLAPYKEDEEIRVLRCRHHFHQSCVDEWFRISGTCPLCIRNLSSPSTGGASRHANSA